MEKSRLKMDEIYTCLISMDYPDAIQPQPARTSDGHRASFDGPAGTLPLTLIQDKLRAGPRVRNTTPDPSWQAAGARLARPGRAGGT